MGIIYIVYNYFICEWVHVLFFGEYLQRRGVTIFFFCLCDCVHDDYNMNIPRSVFTLCCKFFFLVYFLRLNTSLLRYLLHSLTL